MHYTSSSVEKFEENSSPAQSTKMTKFKAVKSFKDFSETATMHGLYKVGHSSSRIKRAAWSITVLGLFGVFIYQLVVLFQDHLLYRTYTEVDMKTDNTMEFPSVTICHANNFKLSEFKKYVPNINELVELTKNKSLMIGEIIPALFSDVSGYRYLIQTNSTLNKLISSTPKSLKWKFKDWCTWSSVMGCKYPNDFADYFYYSEVGFCETFNPKGTFTQIAPGAGFGLQLKLFIDGSDKVPILANDGNGLLVMIHPKDVYPNPVSEALLIPTGYKTRIGLKKTIHHRQKSPYPSNCTDGTGFFQIHPGKYRVKNCQYTCFIKEAMEKCGQIEAAFRYHQPIKFKEAMKTYQQRKISFSDLTACFRDLINKYLKKQLLCNCPPPCTEEIFHTHTSHTQWPQLADMDYHRELMAKFTNRNNITNQDVYNSVVYLQIYYEELGHHVIREQIASPLSKLGSNIGGQFGLWLGASVFSMVEILIYLFTNILRIYENKVRPNKELSKDELEQKM